MQKKFSKRRLANRFVFLINILLAGLLLLSQLLSSVSPKVFWPAELFALSYPLFLLLNILFVIYWIILQDKRGFLSFLIVLAGFQQLQSFYQLRFLKAQKTQESVFTVMTYNVRLFDLYNWTGNLKTRSKILYQLRTESPDIVCFQEFYNSDRGDFKNTDTLLKILPGYKAHVEYGITLRKVDHWGLATFTRYPILKRGKLIYEKGKTNFGLYTDVKIDDDTVRIYNIHLQSNHFKEKDYRFIEAPDSGSNEEIMTASRSILKRLKEGAVKRAQQVNEIRTHISSSPYPVILCGDFNDPPFTYAYKKLSEDLNDSFITKGKGTGATYIGKIPFFRIDYILYDDHVDCISHEVINSKWSDHFPVLASFKVMR